MNTGQPALAIVATALILGGCTEARLWEEEGPIAEADGQGDDYIVLFAPVDSGPVAEVNPDASIDFARDLSTRLSVPGFETRYSETLPVSSSPVWDEGPVGAAAGANVIVLTVVERVEVGPPRGAGPGQVEAEVRMRALNLQGEELLAKTATASVPDVEQVKNMRPGSRPVSKAAWEASKKALETIEEYLDKLPEGRITRGLIAPPPSDQPGIQVDVTVDSTPPGADILVDGVFRGNTPAVVPLPVREITLRIQRQGYQPWEQTLVPSSEMHIKPALEPLPGTR